MKPKFRTCLSFGAKLLVSGVLTLLAGCEVAYLSTTAKQVEDISLPSDLGPGDSVQIDFNTLPSTDIAEGPEAPDSIGSYSPRSRRTSQVYPSVVIVDEPEVRRFVKYYSGRERRFITRALEKSGEYLPQIKNIFVAHGLPLELTNLALLESGFEPNAVGLQNVLGLWQLKPATARQYGLRISGSIDERKDVLKSSTAVAKHLVDLYTLYTDWYLAIAAYNAGRGSISRAIAKSQCRNFFHLARRGVLRPVTTDFVPKFLAITKIVQELGAANA